MSFDKVYLQAGQQPYTLCRARESIAFLPPLIVCTFVTLYMTAQRVPDILIYKSILSGISGYTQSVFNSTFYHGVLKVGTSC